MISWRVLPGSERENTMRMMRENLAKLCLLIALALVPAVDAQADLVDLDAFVTFSILDGSGNPLPDGSLIMIIGSQDAINDGMYAVPHPDTGGAATNLVANSLQGDDILLGVSFVGQNTDSNGVFDSTVQFDTAEVSYVYIRYFDFNGMWPTGLVAWGTSPTFQIPAPQFGVSEVEFDQNGQLQVQNTNNFVGIPEPGTANLFALFFALLWGMRKYMKNDQGGGRGD